MSPASAPPPSEAISQAFAGPDRAVMEAADALAGRIAAGELGKQDTPTKIRDTFDEAGFGAEMATAEVSRRRAVISALDEIKRSDQAGIDRAEVDGRAAALTAELKATGLRIKKELESLPRIVSGYGELARRRLQHDLLPPFVKAELAELTAELHALAPHVQRLEQLRAFQPATVSADFLAGFTTPERHRGERDRIARHNADGQKQHENLVRWLHDRKAQAHRLQSRVEKLRKIYLP